MTEKCTAAIMLQNSYTDDVYKKVIDSFGFNKQNEALLQAGYVNLKTNYKLLKAFNGDIDAIFNKLGVQKKQQSKTNENDKGFSNIDNREEFKIEKDELNVKNEYNPCTKQLRVVFTKKGDFNKQKERNAENDQNLLKIIENGWIKQNTYIIEAGFLCHKKNFLALKDNNGDAKKALCQLQENQRRLEEELKRQKIERQIKEEAKIKMLDELYNLGYMDGYKKLIQAGYTKIPRNYQFLKAYSGDANKIIKSLEYDTKLKLIEEKLGIKLCGIKHEKIPDGINTLIIDGSSIPCVEEIAKKLILGKRKNESDRLIIDIIKRFCSKGQGLHCIVIFEQTSYIIEEIINSEARKLCSFIVKSVRPAYTSICHLIEDWMQKNAKCLKQTMFISYNKELAVYLLEKGLPPMQLMGSNNFIILAKKYIGQDMYNQLLKPYIGLF